MTKEDIKKFATRIVSSNPKTKELAKKITGRNAEYSQKDVNNIILSYLERNKYNNDVIATIMQYHVDRPFFDKLHEIKSNRATPYNDEKSREKELTHTVRTKETEQVKDSKLDCAACATFSAEGDDVSENLFSKQKTLIWVSAAVLTTVILLASTTK